MVQALRTKDEVHTLVMLVFLVPAIIHRVGSQDCKNHLVGLQEAVTLVANSKF